jgi:glutaredoxin
MKKYLLGAILFMVFFLPLVLRAQIYFWIDENGVKHYSDTAPETRKGLRDFKVIENGPDSQTSGSEEADASSNAPAAQNPQKSAMPKVTVYTTSWCPTCKYAKNWLNQNKVPYQEYDIEVSSENHQRYKEAGGVGKIPFIVVGNNKMTGFNEDLMRRWIGMNP